MILRLSAAKVGRAINSAIINEISAALLCWAGIKMCTAMCCCVAVAMLLMVLTSDASSVASRPRAGRGEVRAGALRSVFIVSVP